MNQVFGVNDVFMLVGAFAAGMVLAVVYMVILWRSIRGIENYAPSPIRVMSGYILRLLIVATGLLLVMSGDIRRLVAAVLGFAVMQIVLIRTVGRRMSAQNEAENERREE